MEEREPWRAQAEAACLSAGLVQENADIQASSAIEGPGVCGIDHPFKVTAFQGMMQPGAINVLSYTSGAPADPQGGFETPSDAYAPLQATPLPSAPQAPGGPMPFRVTMRSAEVMSCNMVPVVTTWLAREVQPAAMASFGVPVVELKTAGTYSCRRQNHARSGRWSEHAFANAIDVTGFVFADGRETRVKSGFNGSQQEQAFWRDVMFGGCQHFNTVLGPGSDRNHEDHLHLDLARHSVQRKVRICRPRMPGDWVPMAEISSPRSLSPDVTGSIQDPPKGDVDF